MEYVVVTRETDEIDLRRQRWLKGVVERAILFFEGAIDCAIVPLRVE